MGWILLAAIIAWFVIDIRRDAKKARERETMEAAKNDVVWYLFDACFVEQKKEKK